MFTKYQNRDGDIKKVKENEKLLAGSQVKSARPV